MEVKSTQEKALAINLDGGKLGTFAEIGAGQEVARWFFHVGRASATVAKSISAYDMVISDDLYGATDHYVSRQRLEAMLNREWTQLVERLDPVRGERSTFFVFANTVATRNRSRRQDAEGWLGMRFQTQPREAFSQIILHVNLLDKIAVSEQEALSILGVNLIHGALYQHQSPETLTKTLMDGLSRLRVDIDTIKFSGTAFEKVDNRLISLQLVEMGLTDATMFTAEGEMVQPAEVLYKRPVLIERGTFRPVTNLTLDLLNHALEQFKSIPGLDGEPVVIVEITLKNLLSGEAIDHRDFLDRVDILRSLGKTVMISNYTRFDRVTASLRRYTQNWLALAAGVPTLRSIFDGKYYEDLSGGILEGLGCLFRGPVRLYIYPALAETGALETSDTITLPPPINHLLAYLRESGSIEAIKDCDGGLLHVFPKEVLASIQSGTPGWEQHVPPDVADLIKSKALFGYQKPA